VADRAVDCVDAGYRVVFYLAHQPHLPGRHTDVWKKGNDPRDDQVVAVLRIAFPPEMILRTPLGLKAGAIQKSHFSFFILHFSFFTPHTLSCPEPLSSQTRTTLKSSPPALIRPAASTGYHTPDKDRIIPLVFISMSVD
jgi:hypothetical protein